MGKGQQERKEAQEQNAKAMEFLKEFEKFQKEVGIEKYGMVIIPVLDMTNQKIQAKFAPSVWQEPLKKESEEKEKSEPNDEIPV